MFLFYFGDRVPGLFITDSSRVQAKSDIGYVSQVQSEKELTQELTQSETVLQKCTFKYRRS